jgi:tetratricopeptide (TPR) repeat protein
MKQTAKYLFIIAIFCLSASSVFAQSDFGATITAVNQLVAQGEQALKAKNYDEAKRLFTEAITAENKAGFGAARRNPRAYVGLTAALKAKGDGFGGHQIITGWFQTEASNVAAYLAVIDVQPLYGDSYPLRKLDYMTEVILLEPENPAHFAARARMLRASAPAAVADYNTALIINPKYTPALRERGDIFLASGEYDKAFADFEQYAQAGGDEQFYRLRRGMTILLKSGATAEAMRDLTQATLGADINLRGEAFYYRGWGNFLANNRPAAQADMTEAAKVDAKRRDDFYYRLVFEALPAGKCKSEKDIREARDDAYDDKKARASRRELSFLLFRINSAAVACYPATGKFNFQRVYSAQTVGENSGNPLLEVSDIRRHQALDAGNLDPNFKSVAPGPLSRAGIDLSNPRENDEAFALYYRTQRNGFVPGDTAGNLKRAAADMEAGEYHRAIAVLNGILRAEPNNTGALEARMRAFYLKRAIIRADAEAARLLKISPNNAAALNIRGLHSFESNNEDEAIDYFNRAIDADPNNPKPIINRGRVYLFKKQYPAALADFERGLKLAPNVAGYLAWRGDAYFGMQKWEEAALSYTEAIVLNEKDLPTRVNLIRALDNSGNKKLADNHHAWLIKNAPDYAGTKAVASRNRQFTADVSKAFEGQNQQAKIIKLFQKISDEFEVIERILNQPETTDRRERINRLSKMRGSYYSILSDIGAIEYIYNEIQTKGFSLSTEGMQSIQKIIGAVKKMKELALTERKKVETELKELQGYL